MAITGYHTSSDISNSQQQPTAATDKQVNCYWAWVSQEQWKPPQTEHAHDNSSMLTVFLLFYACAMV